MKAVERGDISTAWLDSFEWLLDERKTRAVNLVVSFATITEDSAVRVELDGFLEEQSARRAGVISVAAVANTLFPERWYAPDRAAEPRKHMYRLHEIAVSRGLHKASESYFDRLVAYPGPTGDPVNQLEEHVRRLQTEASAHNPKSSVYEIGVSYAGDLRIQAPGKDRRIMGFPCLSHISLSLHEGAVHLTALYRNQDFVRKAYGNYVGLARLARFLATEVGVSVGEIVCVASHAYTDTNVGGVRELRRLVKSCRDSAGSLGQLVEVDRAR